MINKVMNWLGYTKTDAATPRDKDGWFVDWARGGASTISGEFITNDASLTIAAVYACINNISMDVAKLPIKIYQKKKGYREEITDHPLRYILDKQPNQDMTAMDFRQALTAHCLGWGNGYSEIIRNVRGEVSDLIPIKPSHVDAYRENVTNRVYYKIRKDNGETVQLWDDQILHIHGLGFDGLIGYNVIHQARESMGLAKATEKFGASYFGNGAVTGGWITVPGELSKAAQERLTDSLEKRHKGVEKAHRIGVLEQGGTFKESTVPPEESQFLETRQFSIPEICRWFRMPPHKIADLSRATFSNIEEQSIEYVTDTLMPWCRRWEQSIWMRLLTQDEKDAGLYVEHVAEGLLRGNIQARYQAYQIAVGNNNNPGFMTINEIRERENMNPVDGGDELFTPQNQVADTSTIDNQEDDDSDDAIIDDMASRIANRESKELEDAKKKRGEKFDTESFYMSMTPRQCEYIEKVIRPLNINIEPKTLIGKTQSEIKDILCSTISKH